MIGKQGANVEKLRQMLEAKVGKKVHLKIEEIKVPEIDAFAKTDLERKVANMARAFRIAGTPFVLPPGTPKDRMDVIQTAFRRAFQDKEFFREYKRLTGDDPTPLLPEMHEKAVREIPREPEVVEVFKKLVGAGPLPGR